MTVKTSAKIGAKIRKDCFDEMRFGETKIKGIIFDRCV